MYWHKAGTVLTRLNKIWGYAWTLNKSWGYVCGEGTESRFGQFPSKVSLTQVSEL